MLDEVRPESQHFIQNCSRHGPETMHRHLIRPDVQGPQSRPQGAFAHRTLPARIAGIGKDVSAVSGKGIQFTEDFDSLGRQGNNMGGSVLVAV